MLLSCAANFVIEYCKDFDAQRASLAAGFTVTYGYELLKNPFVEDSVQAVVANRLESADIDAEWLKMELVDNHRLARHTGKLSASNTALGLLGKHSAVDAFSPERVEITGSEEIRQRLNRARDRMKKPKSDVPSFI